MSDRKPLAVLAGKRTPFAKSFTTLQSIDAVGLATHAVRSVIQGAGDDIQMDQIDQLILGNVAGPPDSANIARVVALRAGLPKDRIAHTVNRNCASGIESIIAAWDAISGDRASLVVAGGTESMSNIPMLWSGDAAKQWMSLAKSKTLAQKLRTLAAFRPRHFKPVVGIELGLTDPVSGLNMGQTAEVLAREFAISRDDQDAYALESHRRASEARERCFLSGEISPLSVEGRLLMEKDNGPRENQSIEQLGRLRPIFDAGGTVTAGNSCPLTDGAAALVLAAAKPGGGAAVGHSKPLGYITDVAIAGCDPHRMGLGPVYATAKLLKQTGLAISDFDLIEINEAFAAQVIACEIAAESKKFASAELGRSSPLGAFDRERTNIHGGAIALGHPVGTTGTRLVLTLLRSLRERGLKRGLATLCVGGGQGVSMVVTTELED